MESVRLQTLNTAAYQQVMVDVHNMRGGLKGLFQVCTAAGPSSAESWFVLFYAAISVHTCQDKRRNMSYAHASHDSERKQKRITTVRMRTFCVHMCVSVHVSVFVNMCGVGPFMFCCKCIIRTSPYTHSHANTRTHKWILRTSLDHISDQNLMRYACAE